MADDNGVDDLVRRSLERLGVPYEVVECDPDFADTAMFCERYGYSPDNSANTIIVASRKEPKTYCACLVLANTKLDVNRAVSRLMGVKRLSFASGEETVALTGMMVGGVTIFGLPEDVPIYIDSNVMQRQYVILGGGSRSWKVKLVPDQLRLLPGATVVDGLSMPR